MKGGYYKKMEIQENLDFKDDFTEADKVQVTFYKFEKPNDFIIGVLKRIDNSDFDGKATKNFVLTTEKGEVILGGYSALLSQIKEDKIGDKLKIVYLGEKKGKSGKYYKEFSVFCH